MRCILTVNFSPWSRYSGGGQRSTHNLARALSRRGHQVSVVYTKPPWERVQVPDDVPYEVIWATLPALRSGTQVFVARQVRRLLAAHTGSAVVHGNGEEAALVASSTRARSGMHLAFVMTPRYPALPAVLPYLPHGGALDVIWPPVLQSKYVSLGRALRTADWICPTSESAARSVQHAYHLSGEHVSVVPNGISDEFIEAARAIGGRPSDGDAAPAFGIFFGRLARDKGVHTILDALTLSREPARFVFVGRGPELERLQLRARKLGLDGRVSFMPWLDVAELSELVRTATFAVLPSLAESFGNSIAEAMALSVPVISTRAGSIPELIEHGRTGLLVAPGDTRALADAMLELSSDRDQARQLGAHAQRHVLEHLTWDESAAAFERIYERALRSSRNAPSA